MNRISVKSKLFIIITLIVILAGMAFFAIGPNQTVDYSNSYEVRVSVNQKTGIETLKSATEEYFNNNGIKTADYAYQEIDGGKILVYKFKNQVPEKISGLAEYVQPKLSETLKVTVDVDETMVQDNQLSVWAIVALGISAVAICLYALIMEKLSGAVATICSSIFSALLFVALVNLTRIPAYPFFGAGVGFALALGSALSVTTANRLKEEYKNSADKTDTMAIADKVMSSEKGKYLFAMIILLVGAVALAALFVPYMMIVGGQIALAGLSALAVAYFTTPLVWASIKGAKK